MKYSYFTTVDKIFGNDYFRKGDYIMEGSFAITADTVKPVTDAINSGLTTLIPIGIGIMGTFIGISLIKRVIYTFL